MGCLGTRLDTEYAAFLPGKIAEGIVAAAKSLQPARIGWASIDDWEHTHNRRWIRRPETEVVDPFGDATGLANMHPGYLSPDVIGPSGPVDPGLVGALDANARTASRSPCWRTTRSTTSARPAVSADYYGLFCKHRRPVAGRARRRERPLRLRDVAGHQRRPDVDGLRRAEEDHHRRRLRRGRGEVCRAGAQADRVSRHARRSRWWRSSWR